MVISGKARYKPSGLAPESMFLTITTYHIDDQEKICEEITQNATKVH